MVSNQLKFAEVADSLQKNIAEKSKVLKDSISTLMKVYMRPKGLKGIHGATPTLQGTIYRAYSFIRSANGEPQANALHAVSKAHKEITEVANRINAFFEGPWKEYQEEVDKIQFSLFKKMDKLNSEE